jgi:hypothetical protein
VTALTTASITAKLNGSTATAVLTLDPPPAALASLTPGSGSVVSGGTVTINYSLTAAAPSAGLTLGVSSSNGQALSVPAQVSVPAGVTSGSFLATALSVSSPTSVTITATGGSAIMTAAVTVNPPVALTVTPATVTLTDGQTQQFTATVSGTNNVAVTWTIASGPGSITPGGVYSAPPLVSASATATVLATSAADPTKSASATVTLAIAQRSVNSVSLGASQVVGGSTVSGQVTLNGVAVQNTAVALSSTNAAAGVPASVTVPAGSSSATFTVTTTAVSTAAQASVSASLNGSTASASLTVNPKTLALASVSPSASTVLSGATVTINYALTGPAPAGGFALTAGSSNPQLLSVPSTILVPAGSTTGSFVATAATASTATPVTITVSGGGTALSAVVTVNPPLPWVTSLAFNGKVKGGTTDTMIYKLVGPAPAGGMTLTVWTSDPTLASVPATVNVPAGASSGSIKVTFAPVSAPRALVVWAQGGGTAYSLPVMVY